MISKIKYLEECGSRCAAFDDCPGRPLRQYFSAKGEFKGDGKPSLSILVMCSVCKKEWEEVYELCDIKS